MPLQKQPIAINFSQGLDQKTDDKQVQVGKFLELKNSVFNKGGRLTKRNGFKKVTQLPNDEQTTLTTLNNSLLATGSNLYAYSQNTDKWINQGTVQPVDLETRAIVRSSANQTSPDAAVAPTGITCTTYVDSTSACYQISDSETGQQIVGRTALPATATNPRVFLLGQYFIITFMATVAASPHLQYIAIPYSMPGSPGTATDISTSVSSITDGYDAVVANNNLYFGWSGASTTVKLTYMSSTLVVSSAVTIAAHSAALVSMAVDTSASTAVVWISFWESGSLDGYTAAYNQSLLPILATTQIITSASLTELTSIADAGVLNVFYENLNNYNGSGAYPTATKTDFISKLTATQGGTVSSPSVMLRSVGLASKPFFDSGVIYMLATYGESNQPTYFLVDSTGNIYMRLAYSNGGGYKSSQVLPTVSSLDGNYYVPYLIKDFLVSTNKNTSLPAGSPVNGIYTQTGVNLAIFDINVSQQYSSNIANALHLTGGQLWEYDGVKPVEHGFQVWPENTAYTTLSTGGSVSAQVYFYVFTYEWTDNQGNLHRSAPSIPLKVDLTAAGTSTSVNSLYVPTLRLTYKTTPNAVRIVGYRWSTAQQSYYQFTSVASPTLNNPAVDYVTLTDSNADATILGQTLLYTTGGVVENIAAPASVDSALYKNRLFLIDAEDRNLLWYSKQVLQTTPVEMSDLFTIYVAPTSGAQGSTGNMTAISAMDDKLIIFKKDAIYYITGNGPDNTGANNDFSEATFITSAVGTENPNSVVLTPQGLMFQSDKGIWLLARDLSTNYIGAAVEDYSDPVKSAQVIPGTNQVRFVLENNLTLMYDYYYGQWGTFNNKQAISSTLYNGLDTYLSSSGDIFQETPGTYLDGSSPVLMSFRTSWINIAGVQGYERFYFANILGTYFSPFKLSMQIGYDYNPSATQAITVTPDNQTGAWGDETLWGGGQAWGGPGNIFSARFFPEKQKCEAFQVTMQENFDFSSGQSPGQGLTLSGLQLTVGVKRGSRTQSAKRSFG